MKNAKELSSERDEARMDHLVLSSRPSSATCTDCSSERSSLESCRQSETEMKPSSTKSCQSSRPFGSYGSKTHLVVTLSALIFLISPTLASMDIWAFEYQRKFGHHLELGQCPMREVAHAMGNKTVYLKQRCELTFPGTSKHLLRTHTNDQNVIITKPDDISNYMGMCGGEAASYLGILNNEGECAPLQIASRLSFSARTLVRAYVSYYQKSLDILDKGTDVPISIRRMRERDSGLENKYYLQTLSYGTQEIVFVQFRFVTIAEAKKARTIELKSTKMTDYMRKIRASVGVPKTVTVISMSTSDPESYTMKKFDTLKSTPDSWNRTVRHVDIQERIIQYTKERIDKNIIKPHLKYHFSPFDEPAESVGRFRINNHPKRWEAISLIEVQLRRDIVLAKKNTKKCRKNKTKLCKEVRQHRKDLIALKAELHKQRAQWGKLTQHEKNTIIKRYENRVDTRSRLTKAMAKEVRAMRRDLKQKRLMRKFKEKNHIPGTSGRSSHYSNSSRGSLRRRFRSKFRKDKLNRKLKLKKKDTNLRFQRHRRRRHRSRSRSRKAHLNKKTDKELV